jgi:hypothetical protein
MNFDKYNRLLKIRKSIGTPTLKVGAHLRVCGLIPSFSDTLESMKCDSRASLLACTFASPCFGHEPMLRLREILISIMLTMDYNLSCLLIIFF